MHILFLYIFLIVFMISIIDKANKHQAEWIVLLLMLSYIKTCAMYLFQATTVFTVVVIGGIEIHLDDIVLIWFLGYCFFTIIKSPLVIDTWLKRSFLLILPIIIALIRGSISGTIGSANFLSDTRKFILFLATYLAFFLLMRKPKSITRIGNFKSYAHRFMNVVLIYILIIWMLDLFFGIRSLPGQYGGTLSDGGSTFRIINPPQVLIIAFYTLWQVYDDLMRRGFIWIRTFLFIMVVIFLQWRTVVAAFLIGLVLVIFIVLREKKSLSYKLIFQLILGIVVIGVLNCVTSDLKIMEMVENLFTSFQNVKNNTGTFATRVEVWSMLLSSLSGINIWLGQPFGFDRAATLTWAASAHSGYVDYIMATGYLGLSCLLIFMLLYIYNAYKKKQYLFAIFGIVQMIYWYGYGFSIEQAALLGFCVAILNNNYIFRKSKIKDNLI